MEWISVKDRPPELGKHVLFSDGTTCAVGMALNYEHKIYYWASAFCFNEEVIGDYNVSHWMPLPPPPKK